MDDERDHVLLQNGMLCQCEPSTPVENGKRMETLIPTPEQVKARATFKQMNFLKRYFSAQIKGINLGSGSRDSGAGRMAKFHRASAAACGERGVEYYSIFKFSEGILFPPINMRGRNGWMVTMTWENRKSGNYHSRRIGCERYFYDAYPFALRLLPEIVAKRGLSGCF
ncbi:MAG: hypothetical protein ACLU4N_02630 [Butyricimonas faecihominis]